MAQLVKHPPAMWETWVLSLGWEDSPGEGKGHPLRYSGLENSIDCIVHGVAKSWTRPSDFHFHFSGYDKYRILSRYLFSDCLLSAHFSIMSINTYTHTHTHTHTHTVG